MDLYIVLHFTACFCGFDQVFIFHSFKLMDFLLLHQLHICIGRASQHIYVSQKRKKKQDQKDIDQDQSVYDLVRLE